MNQVFLDLEKKYQILGKYFDKSSWFAGRQPLFVSEILVDIFQKETFPKI